MYQLPLALNRLTLVRVAVVVAGGAGDNTGVRKLEAFFGFLVSMMAITFGVEYFISDPNELHVLEGIVIPTLGPQGDRLQYLLLAVGILGAVIMPHNIFLHSALVQVWCGQHAPLVVGRPDRRLITHTHIVCLCRTSPAKSTEVGRSK